MPKKSRRRAARYSELSKSKKRRPGARPAPPQQPKAVSAVSDTTTQETAVPAVKKSPVPAKTTAAQGPKKLPGVRLVIPEYRYVRDDLKRVGILTAAIVVIIIILAFVLG